jgi:hypothetical protein
MHALNAVKVLLFLHTMHVDCLFNILKDGRNNTSRVTPTTPQESQRLWHNTPHYSSKRTNRYWIEGEREFDRDACDAARQQYRGCWGGASCLSLRRKCDRACPLQKTCLYNDASNSNVCKEFGWATRC